MTVKGMNRSKRIMLMASLLLVSESVEAVELMNERISEVAALEGRIGRLKLRGSGKLSGDVQRLRGGVQVRELFQSPLFVSTEARFDQERRLPYDLRRWGGEVGVGWALNERTDLLATYRLDSYKVFETGPSVDPAFRSVAGRSAVTALGAALDYDSRDDTSYPTRGMRARLKGELALEALGGDYDLGRIDTDLAGYARPWRGRAAGSLLDEITLVEHLHLGWVENFGDTDEVPFFERYFTGGTNTVRGHRSRWLTPRGLEDQFVGGEIQVVNNIEARVPIFTQLFHRQLSAAAFFDMGRAFRRFSDIGDFRYGVGGGLRYVVHLWKIHGVVRVDYGFSLGREGDDSSGRWHVSVGLPF